MDRRTYLSVAGTAAFSSVAGCMKQKDDGTPPAEGGTGTDGTTEDEQDSDGEQVGMLSTAVSDDPGAIDDFEQLVVTVTDIWVHPKGSEEEPTDEEETEDSGNQTEDGNTTVEEAQGPETGNSSDADNTSDEEGNVEGEDVDDGGTESKEDDTEDDEEGDGRIHIDVDNEPADLVQLQGDAQKVISSEELPTGEYGQIKLGVADETDAVLTDGSEADVMTPGNAPLMFKKDFEVREGTKTTFTADFSPRRRGPNGYILKPVADEVRVEYSDVESDDETSDSEEDGTGEGASDGNETSTENDGADEETETNSTE